MLRALALAGVESLVAHPPTLEELFLAEYDDPGGPGGVRPVSGFAGTGQLVRLALRRDRVRIPVWVVSVAAITYLTAVSEEGLYTSQAAIDAYAELSESSPVAIAFAGPPIGLHTLPGIVVYEMSLMAILGVSLMSVFMVSRHSRAEEESGRSEMLRATEVGRHAGGAAALLTTALACLLMGLGVWLALLPSVLPDDAALVFGAEVALLGLVFAGLTLCLAQLFVHARTVSGAGLMTFAVAYVVRAAGDIRGDWLVWLSPIGWVQATHVPTENRWWPLLVPLVACALLLVLAVVLAERRDFGGGMVPTRAGPARAPRTLSGTVGLAWRTQRGALLGWVVGMLLLGAVTGMLSQSMEDMVKDNPQMADYLEIVSGASVVDAYLATVVLIFALTAAGFAVWSAGHPGADEDEAQLDLLLATPLSRTRSLLGNLVVTHGEHGARTPRGRRRRRRGPRDRGRRLRTGLAAPRRDVRVPARHRDPGRARRPGRRVGTPVDVGRVGGPRLLVRDRLAGGAARSPGVGPRPVAVLAHSLRPDRVRGEHWSCRARRGRGPPRPRRTGRLSPSRRRGRLTGDQARSGDPAGLTRQFDQLGRHYRKAATSMLGVGVSRKPWACSPVGVGTLATPTIWPRSLTSYAPRST